MGWSLGFDERWQRDIGYGVPAYCDHPGCGAEIDRGLGHVCGSEPYGGEHGCGLYFCEEHLGYREPRGHHRGVRNCHRCLTYKRPYKPTADHPTWTHHKETDPSWAQWRETRQAEAQR